MEESELRPPPPLATRIAVLTGLVIVGVLGFFMASRLGSALQEQARLEEARVEAAEAAGSAREVTVVRPTPTQTAPVVVLTGTLEPTQAADLAFGAAGQVARVEVQLGERVEAGDVLVTLDRASIGAQSAQSAAAIRVAEANVEMARDRVRLREGLVESGSMAARELTTARQELAISEAQLAAARAGRRQVAVSTADHILRAPFDGVVTRVPSGVGVAASPGVPLARVENLSSLRLRTTVNRSELEMISVGLEVSVEGSDAVGTLSAVVRSLDALTRRAPVEVLVPNESGSLVANSFVRARVPVGAERSVLRIPATSRRLDGTVYVVGEGARVEKREIVADVGEGGDWLVTDGLSPEDRVVTRPTLVREGMVVSPSEGDGASRDP